MRRKNGYTVIDILAVIVGLGLLTLFTIPKLSYAFLDNKDELYNESLNLYLTQAENYGNTIKDEVKADDTYIVSIKDLVDKGYIGTVSGSVNDIRDGSSMLDIKFHLIYDEEHDNVYAELV